MSDTARGKIVYIGAQVPEGVADAMKDLADANERSTAAEVRLALRAWIARAERAA